MTKKQRALIVIEYLEQRYPEAICSLVYNKGKPYELLIATRLSAQCTDARVNIVTKPLFERYLTLEQLANADVRDIEEIIRSCGFYKVKSKDIIEMSKQLIERHNGELPSTIEELTDLSGIGRKTANLIMGDIFHQPAVVADTHCIRICKRIGLTTTTNPLTTENELKKILPPDKSNDFCHRLVLFGRDVCKAPNSKCDLCGIGDYCKSVKSS